MPARTIRGMTEPGDTAATNAELFGEEDTAAQTQIVDTRTSLHVRRVRLSVKTGPAAGREYATDKERIRIGNARVPPGRDGSGNDLALDDKKVSRFHCENVASGNYVMCASQPLGSLLDRASQPVLDPFAHRSGRLIVDPVPV